MVLYWHENNEKIYLTNFKKKPFTPVTGVDKVKSGYLVHCKGFKIDLNTIENHTELLKTIYKIFPEYGI